MLNLGVVPAVVRFMLWSSLAFIMRRVGRKEVAARFKRRAIWNSDMMLWWEGAGPLPESRHANLIASLDLVSLFLLIGVLVAAAFHFKW
jgi:hypothetical protein